MSPIIRFTFYLSITLSLLSQLPQILAMNIGAIFHSSWVLVFCFLILSGEIYYSSLISKFAKISLLFITYIILLVIVTSINYFDFPHLTNLFQCLFLLITSYYVAPLISIQNFNFYVSRILLVCGFILAVSIYVEYFQNFDIMNRIYDYPGKNSASQILLSCLIIVLFLLKSKNILWQISKISFIGLISIFLLMLKSRATILGLFVVLAIVVIQKWNKKYKIIAISTIGILTVFLIYNEAALDTLINGVLLSGRDADDLNDVSSGRMVMFDIFPELFIDNLWFGGELYFMESFPLSILLQFGSIGSLFFFSFLIFPIIFIKKHWTLKNPVIITFSLLVVTYYLNGIFEQQAPLGPGVKNFLLWVFMGYLINKSQLKV